MVGYDDQSIVQELSRIYLRQFVSTRSHSLPGARLDGNLRCLSGYSGVNIHTSRSSRKWGRSSADSPSSPVTAQGRLRYRRDLAGLPCDWLN